MFSYITNKRYNTVAEIYLLINIIKLRYPKLFHLDSRNIIGISITESGKTVNDTVVVDNEAFRDEGWTASYGCMQVITHTADNLKKKHPGLPELGEKDVRGVYQNLRNPYVSVAYGMHLINDNYQAYNSINKAIRAYNGAISNPVTAKYLSKVLANKERYA